MLELSINIIASAFSLAIKDLLLKAKFEKSNLRVNAFVYYSALIVTEMLLYFNMVVFAGNASDGKAIITGFLVMGTFYLCSLCYDSISFSKRIVCVLELYLPCCLGEFLMASLVSMIKPELFTNTTLLLDTIISCGGSIIAFLIISIICIIEKRKRYNMGISLSYTCLLLITPFLTIYILTFFPIENLYDQNKNFHIVIVLVFLIVLNFLNYYFLESILDHYELKATADLMAKQVKVQSEKYTHVSQAFKETRGIVHDIKKHDKYILSCLQTQKYKEIEDTIKKNLSDLDTKYIKVNSGNLVIDTFIGNFLAISEEKKYHTEYNIAVDNQSIPVTDYDLNVVIGNLIDNCLNACSDLDPDECNIKIDMITNEKFFVIQISNPLVEEKAKNDSIYHGYGILNIKKIVEKYEGVYYNSKENCFKTTITFPIFRDSSGMMIPIISKTSNAK
ncbi:MAG: GHKL domain-containing protein [Lachnospiraceae bacterium]|nr:GHKL domain-containing protein [Lachnospiraceae bacterium]